MADLESLLQRLSKHKVRYVVVGGFAAVAHGATLVTWDLDICCSFAPANLLRLQRAIADLHAVHRMTPKRIPLNLTKETCRGLKNLYLDTDLGQLDCLGEINGVGGYDEVRRHATRIQLSWGRCPILDIDALIRSKEAMPRPRDRQAVHLLKALQDAKGGAANKSGMD